jgi:hypothetical protein
MKIATQMSMGIAAAATLVAIGAAHIELMFAEPTTKRRRLRN